MKRILAVLTLGFLVSCNLFELDDEKEDQGLTSLPAPTNLTEEFIPNILNSSCTITNDGVIGESSFATFTAAFTSGVEFSGVDEQKRLFTGKLTRGKIYIKRDDTAQIFAANLSVQNSFYANEDGYMVGFVKDNGIVSISTAEGTIGGRLVAAAGLSCQISYKRDANGDIITGSTPTGGGNADDSTKITGGSGGNADDSTNINGSGGGNGDEGTNITGGGGGKGDDDTNITGGGGGKGDDDTDITGEGGGHADDDTNITGGGGGKGDDDTDITGGGGGNGDDETDITGGGGGNADDDTDITGGGGGKGDDDTDITGEGGGNGDDDTDITGEGGGNADDDTDITGGGGGKGDDETDITGEGGGNGDEGTNINGSGGGNGDEGTNINGSGGGNGDDDTDITGEGGGHADDDTNITGGGGGKGDDDTDITGGGGGNGDDETDITGGGGGNADDDTDIIGGGGGNGDEGTNINGSGGGNGDEGTNINGSGGGNGDEGTNINGSGGGNGDEGTNINGSGGGNGDEGTNINGSGGGNGDEGTNINGSGGGNGDEGTNINGSGGGNGDEGTNINGSGGGSDSTGNRTNPIIDPYNTDNPELQFSLDVSSKSLLKAGESSQLKIRVSDPVNYTPNTINIDGTALSVSGSGTEFTAYFKAPTSGSDFLTIDIPETAFVSNEKKSVGTSLGVVYDADKPTVKLYSSVAKLQKMNINQTLTLYIEAQEIIKGLTADDIRLSFGKVEELTPESQTILYRAEIKLPESITPAQEKAGLKITIPANSFSDQAGNPNSQVTQSIAYSDSSLPALLSWPYQGLVLDENVMKGATIEDATAENYYQVALEERKIAIPQNLNYKNVRTNVSNILSNFADYQEREEERVNSFLLKGVGQIYKHGTLGKDQDLDETGWMLYLLQSQVFSLRFSALYWSLGSADKNSLLKFIKGLTGTEYSYDNLDETVFYDFNKEKSLRILRGVQLSFAEDIKRFFSQSSGVKINQSIIKSAWANAIINSTSVNKEEAEKFFPRYLENELEEQDIIDQINNYNGNFTVSWGFGGSRVESEEVINKITQNLSSQFSSFKTDASSLAWYAWTEWEETGQSGWGYDNQRFRDYVVDTHFNSLGKIWNLFPNSPSLNGVTTIKPAAREIFPERVNIGYIGGGGLTLAKDTDGEWYLYENPVRLKVKLTSQMIEQYESGDFRTNYVWAKGTLRKSKEDLYLNVTNLVMIWNNSSLKTGYQQEDLVTYILCCQLWVNNSKMRNVSGGKESPHEEFKLS